jgi:tetratricopeptide (TPR) repeat protein
MSARTPNLRLRWLLTAVLAAALVVAVFCIYERTRPRLHARAVAERTRQVRDVLENGGLSPRATAAAAREFFLDYPTTYAPRVRLLLAQFLVSQPDANYDASAREIEQAAMLVLSHLPPGKVPRQRDFEKEGFRFVRFWGQGWPAPFLTTDIDGDGVKDVLFACPGNIEPSVCCLFRSAPQGWVRYRLGCGAPIIGLWVFDVTPRGPKAVVLASLADSEYRPNLLFDVFAWQEGRMNSVLAARIPNGWQWEHRAGSNGAQEIRLFGSDTPPDWRQKTKRVIRITYRWDGRRYGPGQAISSPLPHDAFQQAEEGRRLMEQGRYREAARAFQAAIQAEPGNEDYSLRRIDYEMALCFALVGNRSEALKAMSQYQRPNGEEEDVFLRVAGKFLKACMGPNGLPNALAAAGQVFRLLEATAAASRPDASPRDILAAAGIRPDYYQDVDLTGDGRPGGLAAFHWQDGSAVVAFRREGQAARWKMEVLTYGLKEKPPEQTYPLEAGDVFYLPDAPALQVQPVASEVRLRAVTRRAGAPPQVVVEYRQEKHREAGVLVWDGRRFATVRPLPDAGPGFETELDGIEARLFERRDFEATLRELDAFTERVRASFLPPDAKSDMLLETYYHQAICFRKQGRIRRAEVLLAALHRAYPDSAWGRLARAWLR